MNEAIVFKIGNTEVDVYWLDNASVNDIESFIKKKYYIRRTEKK